MTRLKINEKLQAMYSEIFEIELPVDKNISIKQIGGNSIEITRLQSRIKQEFGVRLGMAKLMKHSSINAMEEIIIQEFQKHGENK